VQVNSTVKRSATARGNAFVAEFLVLLDEEGKYNKMDSTQLKATLSELDAALDNEMKEAHRAYSDDKKAVAQVLASRAK